MLAGEHERQWRPDGALGCASRRRPGEAEVELYANGAHGYVELEDQGRYVAIPGGGERTWVMPWYLRELPPLATLAENPGLLDFVRGQL